MLFMMNREVHLRDKLQLICIWLVELSIQQLDYRPSLIYAADKII